MQGSFDEYTVLSIPPPWRTLRGRRRVKKREVDEGEKWREECGKRGSGWGGQVEVDGGGKWREVERATKWTRCRARK